jgi:tetratricopeptide (TPR) repeat protein
MQARLNRTAHSQARTMFERAISLDQQYAPAYVGLGRIDLSAVALGWTQDPEAALRRAEELARKAISLDEFNPAAHVLLGRAYARQEDYERAVEALRRAVALNPSDPDSNAGLGDALLWSGDVEGAIKALEIATSADPRLSAEDLFSLGAAYFLIGRIADATRVFERVTIRKEGNPFTYAMLAAVYAETGRDNDSRLAAAEVRKLNPFFDVFRFGSLFRKAEHRDRLATALKKAGL